MSTVDTSLIQSGYEPIPGYRLEEQIGSGGFGEVWRAEAPGGLHKAIKFVHGALSDRQATRELRSLERIKGVHHPFLLTLERFEVVAGRLIIVTELADGSLEDVYRRHRDRGSCGIPRAALLAYLHDAADALDYLHNRYQLQHLDVKPGNLLMVGGHVKIADFGLLKDLRDVECSMVGGLTPIYAPPEVFDGRPSPTSDQYSLAVMYQELLTGTRPFTGRTIAQLATQHVHSAPNLDPLPASDRPIIARSLEKNPTRRYGGCMELVEALRAAGDRSSQPRNRAESVTICNGDTQEIDGDTRTSTLFQSGPPRGAVVEDLPSLKTGPSVPQTRSSAQALLVAVGGTGAECLQRLRERIAADTSSNPLDLHCVLIDTSSESIDAARISESCDRLRPCMPIWIPLRTPAQYRESGTKHLASVSRRWVYNIPRSGRTEGLRPLGRLALVDHGADVWRKLSEAVQEFAAAAGDGTPQVYLVGSLGGGTGSGTAWDLAHLLRDLLDHHGLPQATVIPLLASPAFEASPREPLATADCHAALTEMHHYLMPGNSYPGDPAVGWPSVPAARSPLKNAYIVAARDGSGQSPTPVEMISDYIWADSTTAGSVLRAARDGNDPVGDGNSLFEPALRSFGIVPLQSVAQIERPRLARVMATRMLHEWLGHPAEARELATLLQDKLAIQCGLDAASLVSSESAAAQIETGIESLRFELSRRLKERQLDMTTAVLCVTRIGESIRAAAESRASSSLDELNVRLSALVESLTDHAAHLAAAIQMLGEPRIGGSNWTEEAWSILPASIRGRSDQMLAALHRGTNSALLAGPVRDVGRQIDGESIAAASSSAARQVIEEALGGVSCSPPPESSQTAANRRTPAGSPMETREGLPEEPSDPIVEAVRSVRPPFLECGGQQRLLLLVGSDAERVALQSRVADAHGGTLSVAVVPGIAPLLVHEAQRIPLSRVLNRIATTLGGDEQISARLQTRSDIRWNSREAAE